MRHQAIYETHSNVVRIDDSFGAFDKDDNLVVLNESLITTKINEIYAAEPMRLLRIERDRLLSETDWVSTRSIDSDTPVSQEWKTYRQALRDLPATAEPKLENGQLTNVTWPEKPE